VNGPFRTINLGALGQAREQAPLPKKDGVLYRHPNPDGTRKSCGNCVLWVSGEEKCSIHPRDLSIDETAWCGYHIFGTSMKTWPDFPGIMPVTPEISGLRMAGPGVACASCRYYRRQGETNGLCVAVAEGKTGQPPIPVESRGVCARYNGM